MLHSHQKFPALVLKHLYQESAKMSLGKQSSSKDGYEPYPFQFNTKAFDAPSRPGNEAASATINLPNVRGRIPSIQASRLRSMIKEAHNDPKKIVAHPCVYDALSARLAEEAGFPVVFCAGYAVASSHGLPDTGYIAMQEMSDKIQQISRIVSVPIFADGDTGYGSPMNVKVSVMPLKMKIFRGLSRSSRHQFSFLRIWADHISSGPWSLLLRLVRQES